jgi:two-component system response regulator AtoC
VIVKRQEKQTILIGEDEIDVQEYLEMALKSLGYSVIVAGDGNEVIHQLTSFRSTISAVLLDLVMPQKDGLETLKEIRQIDPTLPVIVASGMSSTINVVAAMRLGATDFIAKPVSHQDLEKALSKALRSFFNEQTSEGPSSSNSAPKTNTFLGSSPKMQDLKASLKPIGISGAPVLIRGETGSGKEVLARELHAHSRRAGKTFLKLNCAALPSELVESELFGYERGAFTGAFQKRAGMFEMANEGTLLLDEIGDMDVRLQAKLLQVLQDQEFQRIGGKEVIKVDVRIMAATHRDLEKAMMDGTFRADLFYRLNVINVELPPLRERTGDILPLTEFLLKKHGAAGVPLTSDLRRALLAYHWPGNVRELENIVRQLIALQNPDLIVRTLDARLQLRPAPVVAEAAAPTPVPHVSPVDSAKGLVWHQVKRAKRDAEANAIVAALDATRWNRKQAAALLEIDYKALLYKMKTLGVEDKTRTRLAASAEEPTDVLQRHLTTTSGLGDNILN